jgi:hypothetical protein
MSTNVQIGVSAVAAIVVGYGVAHFWPKTHIAVPIGATVVTYLVAKQAVGMAVG